MTSKERVEAAMNQQRPDEIPVMCQMANGHTVINTGIHPIEYFLSDEVWTDCLLQMRENYDFDGILCHKPGRVSYLADMIDRRDYDAEVPSLFLNDGSRIDCTRDDDSYYKKNDDFAFPELDDLDVENPLAWAPESYLAFQASKATYPYDRAEDIPDEVFGTIDRVIAAIGDTHSVHGEVRAPFDHMMNILGMEDGLMATLDDPEKTYALLERVTKWSVALAVAQVRRGAHAIKISSPFAGMGFLSRDMYAEFIVPCERQIADAVRAEG
ncbi:MAG: uroporphyrinogen-III decarboxylase, partial [Kiritimatiellia bacterium]